MEYIYHYKSPLGEITLASDGENLTGLWFDGQKHFGENMDSWQEEKLLPVFQQTIDWLNLYFLGQKPEFIPPLRMKTTAFRKLVWDVMLTIPWGETMTYGQIAVAVAKKMGKEKMSAQAVGGAVGHNAISLIIPCHRVIGANGSMTGYAGGIERKIALLELERIGKLPSEY